MASPLKGKKRPNVFADWGTGTMKTGASKKKVKVYSRMSETVQKEVGLKVATFKPTLKKDKKGRGRLVLSTGGAQIAKHVSSHYLRVHTGKMGKKGKNGVAPPKYIRVPVPTSLSLSQAAITLSKSSKVKRIKFPGGETYIFKK